LFSQWIGLWDRSHMSESFRPNRTLAEPRTIPASMGSTTATVLRSHQNKPPSGHCGSGAEPECLPQWLLQLRPFIAHIRTSHPSVGFAKYQHGYSLRRCREWIILWRTQRNGVPKTVFVNGYQRRDGTYVRGHYRSAPGSNPPRLYRIRGSRICSGPFLFRSLAFYCFS